MAGERGRSKIDAKLCRMKMDAALTRSLAAFVLGRKKIAPFQCFGVEYIDVQQVSARIERRAANIGVREKRRARIP
ncbi:hypothetical protein [Bradyrhizobium centrolobii]|uniref:hypothetical protein n=1 Tax=Bradyrhizobium centrolobii TaxID=1505087 RepID=UPI000AB82615|nr:hypothetical protein [Bradyrhizobium centrolobii]